MIGGGRQILYGLHTQDMGAGGQNHSSWASSRCSSGPRESGAGSRDCLNLSVPLGHCELIVYDPNAFVKIFNQAVKSQTAKVRFSDTEVTLRFRDWIPPHEGSEQASVINRTNEDSA